MKYSTKTGNPADFRTDCMVVTLARAKRLAAPLGARELVSNALDGFTNDAAQTVTVTLPGRVRRLVIAGGDGATLDAESYQRCVKAAVDAVAGLPIRNVVWCLNDFDVTGRDAYWKTRNALRALSDKLYWFDAYKSTKDDKPRPARISVLADGRSRRSVARAVQEGQALDEGMTLARELGNQPGNVCNPTYLARAARRLGRNPKVTVNVLEERQMAELGMGAFLSVTQGSETPGKLIVAQYKGGKPADDPVVLIGKGITFDTGGISLKPGAGMDEMKFDMCGAASVLGALSAAISAKLPINLIVMVAAAENMPSGKASRPGDIVTTMSGQTVEILNTDAEGRLVLCDAVTYAERFKPKAVVDVATLTGACVVALGSHASGVFANDDSLARELERAGTEIWDRVWVLPIWADYDRQLKSPHADMANVGGREAGAITAACFIARFAKNVRWAHVDIAGTAWRSGADKGATGRPVPMLFEYLLGEAA